MFSKIALIASILPFALAQIIPTSPSGNTVVNAGGDIQALWNADTSGQWTDVEIQLMTGDNLNMVPLAVLATGIDGTSQTSLDIPCPDVSPYSKIYFLQFTRGGNVSTATWTTRFTIASAQGQSVAPEQETNYSGNVVQWGTGALVNAAPDTIMGGSNSTSTSSSNSTSAAPSSAMSASSASQAVVASASSASASSASMMASTMSSMTSMSRSASGTATPASAAPSTSSSGAALKGSTVGLGAVVLALAGLIAV